MSHVAKHGTGVDFKYRGPGNEAEEAGGNKGGNSIGKKMAYVFA